MKAKTNQICKNKSYIMVLQRELQFLNRFSDIIEKNNDNLTGICKDVAQIIPQAMRSPTHTSVKININNNEYLSSSYKITPHKYERQISIEEKAVGSLAVFLDIDGDEFEESIFSIEEKEIINYISERLGRVTQRCRYHIKLNETRELLKEKNKALEVKNITLSEIMKHIELNKNQEKEKIQIYLETLVLPYIEKLKFEIGSNPYLELIEMSLKNLTSSEDTLLKKYSILSQREIEICNLLKTGMSSKDVGKKLTLSSQTIDKHRANIRKKLGISGKKENMISYLKSIR
ncbi:MAG: helix-turn-helix transcriptional regulator [Spirochaetales bacterium]|nr:helix-turn-helix transcriptional regulator [Spirochaetales bacterium]